MTFMFRLRARLGATVKVESPDVELMLYEANEIRVVLKALDGQTPLRDSPDIVITGRGYATAGDAERAGEAWWGHVMVGFARLGVGADFGERAPQGGFSDHMLNELRNANRGIEFFNDRPGVIVYPEDPPAYFLHGQATGVVGKMGPEVVRAIQKAHERRAVLSDRFRLAYDLYSGSFFQPAADARFLMLSMALETMIEQQERASEVRALVDKWMASLADSDLDEPTVQSIRSGLDGLTRESVGQAGRRLAATLNGRNYLGKPAVQFFTHCYTLRSRLVHGRYPRPTREEVDLAAAHLEKFVGDLLGIALLADFPH